MFHPSEPWATIAILWTARIALALYAAVVAAQLLRRRPVPAPWERWVWFAGAVGMLLHLLVSLAWRHDFSHDAAYADTARRTAETFGLVWGGGIYFNYVLVGWWLLDAVWWIFRPASYLRRLFAWTFAFHAYLLFMASQGAIVFARTPANLIAGALFAVLAALILWRAVARR